MDKEKELIRLQEKFEVKADDRVGMINVEDALNGAISTILGHCNRTEVIEPLVQPIRDLATIKMNRVGVEGESSRGEGGVSQSFVEGIPSDIRTQINSYRIGKASRLK